MLGQRGEDEQRFAVALQKAEMALTGCIVPKRIAR
jgi:hypothetical protein